MNSPLVDQIAEAVLYEGYVLYPYRASSKKNQRERFTFGRVYPRAYSIDQGGAEPFVMQTECLVKATTNAPKINISVRFLHPMTREIGALQTPMAHFPNGTEPHFTIVPELRMDDQLFQPWQEAIERKVSMAPLAFGNGSLIKTDVPFRFFAARELEVIRDRQKLACGVIVRHQQAIEGTIEITVQPLQSSLNKITVRILNHTPLSASDLCDRETLSMRTFASTHAILTVEGAEFISLIDPPPEFKEAAGACKNLGAWPVLVGDEAQSQRDTMLSSPIILYDYPKIAPESAGPLFDGTEIDEILTLRILTMTDEEKHEMRHIDAQARRLLERTEALPQDSLLKMHGAMRPVDRETPIEFDDFFGASTPLQGVAVGDIYLRAGDRVRIRPKGRADVMDLALNGQTAIIEAVEQDLEKRIHLALVLENDPGKDLGLLRQPGHRFFYGLDEVEPLREEFK
jgi:hydrogenase maturation protease